MALLGHVSAAKHSIVLHAKELERGQSICKVFWRPGRVPNVVALLCGSHQRSDRATEPNRIVLLENLPQVQIVDVDGPRVSCMPAPVHWDRSVSPHLLRLWEAAAASRGSEGARQPVSQHNHASVGHLAIGGGELPAHATHAHAKDHRPLAVLPKHPPRNSSAQGEHRRPLGWHPKHVEEAAAVSGADEDLLHGQQVEGVPLTFCGE